MRPISFPPFKFWLLSGYHYFILELVVGTISKWSSYLNDMLASWTLKMKEWLRLIKFLKSLFQKILKKIKEKAQHKIFTSKNRLLKQKKDKLSLLILMDIGKLKILKTQTLKT